MIDRSEAAAGYDIHLFNATMEHGIPSVWALAKNRKQKGLNIICAAGAHLDPVRAVKSAVFELAGMMLTLDDKLEENRDEVEKMLQDSSLVRKMDDHGMLYGLPQAEERLQFLLDDDRPMRTFAEEYGEKVKPSGLDGRFAGNPSAVSPIATRGDCGGSDDTGDCTEWITLREKS